MAALRIERTQDMHEPYRFLREARLGAKRVVVASWPSTRYNIYWPMVIKRPVTQLVDHLAVVIQTLCAIARGRFVIVREYSNMPMACVALLLWPWRRRILLNVNDNFAPHAGRVSRMACQFLRRLGFTFMLLDGARVREEIMRRIGPMSLVTPNFSVPDRRAAKAARAAGSAFRVGFVGYFRRDKGGMTSLTDALRELQRLNGVEVALGYWNRAQAESLPPDVRAGLILCETLSYPRYLEFLDSCDVVVLLATPAYVLRHSGVLVDCVSRGTPVLCRDYPLLAFQALHPVPVGAVYRTLDELPARVVQVRARHAELLENFNAYFRERAAARVLADLERQWTAATGNGPPQRRGSGTQRGRAAIIDD